MKLLDSIFIRGKVGKHVELWQGDLTFLAPDEGFDLLVVSAFPYDYTPTPTSLIGALYRKGLSVELLAADKEIDLRANFSCWLSKEFTHPDESLRFKRILCFEPLFWGKPPELVGDIYRALTPILADRPEIKTIAMPLVAAGDQGYSVSEILVPLLEATIHWLESGLPLDCVKIITYSDTKAPEAIKVFSEIKTNYFKSSPIVQQQIEYDVFISYARENQGEAEVLEKELREIRPSIKIFLDRKNIDIGSPWQPEIFESLDKCRKVVVFLSPDYLNSKVCKEEFNIAWIRSRETDEDIIFPVYLYTAGLPTYMKYRNYYDCREGDKIKITEATKSLLNSLDIVSGNL